MNLSFEKCDNHEIWDQFILETDCATFFLNSKFLVEYGLRFDLWVVKDNNNILLGGIVFKDEFGKVLTGPMPYCLYQGLCIHESLNKLPPHRGVKKRLEIIDCFIENMTLHYPVVSFFLHYAQNDLRSFQWFNYHKPESGQFDIKVHYTGILNLSDYASFDEYLKHIRECRKQEYKRALKDGLSTVVDNNVDALIQLYELTFERQDIAINPLTIEALKKYVTLGLKQGWGELMFCVNGDGEKIAAIFFIYDNGVGYYMVAANNPAFRNSFPNTLLLLQCIKNCFERAIKKVDLVGLNSPNRGDFKTSFNCIPHQYATVSWKKPVEIC